LIETKNLTNFGCPKYGSGPMVDLPLVPIAAGHTLGEQVYMIV